MSIDEIRGDFALLDDWEDRYRYVIELGRALEPLPEAARTEANKVQGCASQVWLQMRTGRAPNGEAILDLVGDSDAHIVRGLVAILFQIYNGKPVREVPSIRAEAIFAELGLIEHLTPQRSNGLVSMVRRIRADAEAIAVREGI